MSATPDGTDAPGGSPSGRVAIVTGASRGIGAGLVTSFRQAGYSVVALARSIPSSDDPGVLVVEGDVAQPETGRRVVEQAVDRFGRVDTLVNNAGIYIGKSFMDCTLDDYHAVTAVNLAGFFHMTQPAIGQMLTQGTGHVVNMSTTLVDRADSRQPSALTSLTKGGLSAVTRSLAIEYAGRGIRVNAIAPGIIQTSMADPASYAGLAELHPLGRLGTISDIVDGILYLERATFVTGEILHIDGGEAAGH